ncbi:MAG: radical SAM protein [Candidatus Omnitrophota bacterium]|jgi:radical SAM protein with 4Fe4S-binding SPASM domain
MKKETSDRFYTEMAALARRKKIPSRVMFELTYKCNFRCVHCYVSADNKKKELTTKEVFSVLDQLKDAGCFNIGFTGGEPLLRKDIFDILEHAKRCGLRISLLTNGYLVDKSTARKLASLGTSLNRVDISVLGATGKTFENITGAKGSFNRVMNSIKLLKREGAAVQVKATLMGPNKDELLGIKYLADKFGCFFRYDPTISRRTDGSSVPLQYQVSPDEVFRIERLLAGDKQAVDDHEDGYRRGIPKPQGRKALFHCGAGQTEVTISPYGEMNFCMEIHYPEYKIQETSFEHCWGKLRNLVENIKLPKKYECKTCEIASFCHWCPAKAWLLKKDLFSCDPESKRFALAQAKVSSVNLQK